MKKFAILSFPLLSLLAAPLPEACAQDRMMDLLKSEMKVQMQELQAKPLPPYYMNYRVVCQQSTTIVSSLGKLMDCAENNNVTFVPQIRLGSPAEDNFKDEDMGAMQRPNQGLSQGILPLPEEDGDEQVRQTIWSEVCNRYDYAVRMYDKAQARKKVQASGEDPSPCFSPAAVETHYEAPYTAAQTALDVKAWSDRLNELSAEFLRYPEIERGEAVLSFNILRTYFVSSEGTATAENRRYANVNINCETITDDGMALPLMLSYFAFTPGGLPSQEQIRSDVRHLAERVIALRTASVVEPYVGPAILMGEASGVFFHEIFGHRIEGQRMRSSSDGRTFKNMVGEYVLPASFQVYDDPTMRQYDGKDLNGYYIFDEQGVRGQRVEVVKQGKMNDFLMTRKPIEGFPASNGHARAMSAFDPVSRQSNLVIESSDTKTDARLRQMLLDEIRAQGKEYGYIFSQVNGGFTNTDARAISSFNVSPLEAWRVYLDGRPDELVRGVDIIGTPLSMFSGIVCAGGKTEVFTGMCGAESGWIPVTAIAPSILVKKVEMQRKPKGQIVAPILPKP